MSSWCRNLSLFLIAAALLSVSVPERALGAEEPTTDSWPAQAQRTGGFLPPMRKVALSFEMGGAWIPQMGDLAAGDTWVVGGRVIWNFSVLPRLGFFGSHALETMGYANVILLDTGTEIGARFRANHLLTLEAAYLVHRLEVSWIGDVTLYPGGVLDRGAEFGGWLHFEWLGHIRLEPHLFGRYFSVYTEDHLVLGSGLRLSLMPKDGHALILDIEFLEVWRFNARQSVEDFTHNTVAEVRWQSQITEHVGVSAAFEFSANLKVGEVPMLELKRSMIGEPMAMGTIGVFFGF